MKKTLIIAEAGVNHNGDFETAKRLIEVASEAGSDFVKFQTFNADEIVIKSAKQARYQTKNIGVTETQHKMLQRLELDRKHHSLLIAYSKKCGIEFLSTAFDIDSLAFLDSLGSRFQDTFRRNYEPSLFEGGSFLITNPLFYLQVCPPLGTLKTHFLYLRNSVLHEKT